MTTFCRSVFMRLTDNTLQKKDMDSLAANVGKKTWLRSSKKKKKKKKYMYTITNFNRVDYVPHHIVLQWCIHALGRKCIVHVSEWQSRSKFWTTKCKQPNNWVFSGHNVCVMMICSHLLICTSVTLESDVISHEGKPKQAWKALN